MPFDALHRQFAFLCDVEQDLPVQPGVVLHFGQGAILARRRHTRGVIGRLCAKLGPDQENETDHHRHRHCQYGKRPAVAAKEKRRRHDGSGQ